MTAKPGLGPCVDSEAPPQGVAQQSLDSGEKTPVNMNNFPGLSREQAGVNCVYMCFHLLREKRETHK